MSSTKAKYPIASPIGVTPQILLVEDEPLARRELMRALVRRGFGVREAQDSEEALQEVCSGDIGVVLMDILLRNGPDGIEAARMIQEAFPQISVIFVTAYAGDSAYRERAERSRVRVAEWIEKPVHRAMPELVQLITKEIIKSGLRKKIAEAGAQGISPSDYLKSLQSADVTPEITQELLGEARHSRSTDF